MENAKPIYHLKPTRNRLFPVKIVKDKTPGFRYAKSVKSAMEYLNGKYGRENIRIYNWCAFSSTFNV